MKLDSLTISQSENVDESSMNLVSAGDDFAYGNAPEVTIEFQ